MPGVVEAPLLFLMGPTASGKTALALQLAGRLPLDVISVDSGMVYRGLDIGTAKPAATVLARVPHRLIDICDPAEAYSAGRFRADALREIAAIRARGRQPLLVGGTGLYFRALAAGLSVLPPADAALRARLDAEAAQEGWPALHARLARIDAASAARIQPNDAQRIQRALEVHALTGRPLSVLQRSARPAPLPVRKLVLACPDRALGRQRIAARFHAMLGAGLLGEVERLYRRGDLGLQLPAIRLVGYRQAWQHLAGELSREEMSVRAIVATCQLAKRQRTWLRAEAGAEWFDPDAPQLVDKVLKSLQRTPS